MVNEWMKKMWYKSTVMFPSVTMKNEIVVCAEQWRELDIPMLSEEVGLGKTSTEYSLQM